MPAEPVAAPVWLSVHVYAHSDLDDHLAVLAGHLHTVAAAVGAHAWFFLRYWEGGPHVRLRVLCSSAGQRTRALELLCAAAEHWAEQNPEREELREAEYAASVAWVLRRETTGRPAAPLRPSRTVRVEPFSGAWMPDAPECTDQPRTLSFLTVSSTVALRLHQSRGWQARLRHAVDTLRSVLGASARPEVLPLNDAVDAWAHRLAGAEAEEVRHRSRLALAASWPPPSRWSTGLGDQCLAIDGPYGSSRTVLHAWHTHCNRLGLNLLEEAAAAWTALALTAKDRG
ncbi:lantibiotic dehydratase C-terminal domain-containing protein [Streptomyces albicerus]|uniref:lantibiotic dehydratase C-terminal domain-containing protein n=1 Tax=Streptomyces albicerus TaxID=2569859 RepID=UPI001788C904|nr:lantibiotic dehydratase C-terminal domain-containing protein [Streptomyces albicerus]